MRSVTFNSEHHSEFTPDTFDRDVNFHELNIRFLAGGASQSFAAFVLLEYYIAACQPEYVVEIGSQKGSLSLCIANHACASEQFVFHTFEIDKQTHWNNRFCGGVGHWFEKLETISPYCKSFELDVFGDKAQTIVRNNIANNKTLIICDGGDKVREVCEYGHFLKPGDMIMAHDFGTEIFDKDIDMEILNIEYHEPWNTRFIEYETKFKTFIKL